MFSFFFIKSFSCHCLSLYQKLFHLLGLNQLLQSLQKLLCTYFRDLCFICSKIFLQLSVVIYGQFKFVFLFCPCPIFSSYLFAKGRAIVWHHTRATTPVFCMDGVLWGWALLTLLNSMWQPWLWTHESQVHIWLISSHFESHWGCIWTLSISRRVEWEANCMLISSATHRVSGKQARVWTSSPCLVCYCSCSLHRLLMWDLGAQEITCRC